MSSKIVGTVKFMRDTMEICPISTNVYVIEEYLTVLSSFVKGDSNKFLSNVILERYNLDFLKTINQPYDGNVANKLKIYHQSKIDPTFINEIVIQPENILCDQAFYDLEILIQVESLGQGGGGIKGGIKGEIKEGI